MNGLCQLQYNAANFRTYQQNSVLGKPKLQSVYVTTEKVINDV